MTLHELLRVLDEGDVVRVWNKAEDLLATDDGANSIPEALHVREVLEVSAGHYTLDITLED